MQENNGKYVGESSRGRVRVRVEEIKPHYLGIFSNRKQQVKIMRKLEKCMEINKASWHDYYVDTILINFEKVTITLLDYYDREVNIVCDQYIGICYLGHWDECVVKNIFVRKGTKLKDKSIKTIRNNYPQMIRGGGVKDIESEWLECVVELIDGNNITIICSDVIIEK